MQLVVDTNVFVAALLKKGDTRKMLFSKKAEFFSPDRIVAETLNHKEEFKKKGAMDEREFRLALELVLENILILPAEEYTQLKQKALLLCPKKHEND